MKRIKIDDVEKSNFYKMPKKIYEFDLKPVDRELYMLCFENWRLSVKNNWINENGEIYFYASQNKLSWQMKIDKKTVISSFKRLILNDLLEAEKELGEPNMYYLADLNEIVMEKFHQYENSTGVVENFHQYQYENSTGVVENFHPIKNNISRTNLERKNQQELSSSRKREDKQQKIENYQQENIFLKEEWNKIAKKHNLSTIQVFTKKRRDRIEELLKNYTYEDIIKTMRKIESIEFLLGKGKNKWKITFDDFLDEDKFTKIMEDAYYDGFKAINTKENKKYNEPKEPKQYGFGESKPKKKKYGF
ncbi:replication initiator protein A [Leptotrichia sp.]|mgnify:CR=1 FL=1|jgi:Replication initiator protein A (RepA) N-terminus.|uniref:replication initiator protein A n=1 Tax=Leptotrichia sp. TaxID=104608 RepID=UPI0017B707E7|nr:replication initiator protein A [Leptotrichia sp.]MBB1534198.1 replication initiator protein A [Leptotrichia sp.]